MKTENDLQVAKIKEDTENEEVVRNREGTGNEEAKRNKGEPSVIVHIPHSSIVIPEVFRREFLIREKVLQKELLCMTDWYTEELFACTGCQMVVHQVSRLVCDPERFLDPDEEGMWQKGMGMYYTRTSDGERMKKSPLASGEGWQSYARALAIYQKHHSRLKEAVGYHRPGKRGVHRHVQPRLCEIFPGGTQQVVRRKYRVRAQAQLRTAAHFF